MTAQRPVGVITGLASESRVAAGLLAQSHETRPPKIRCAGASPQRAADLARNLLTSGISGLISFGIAGGLDPELLPGQVMVPEAVFTPEHHLLPCHKAWRQQLCDKAEAKGIALHPGRIAGSEVLAPDPGHKAALREVSKARAVDMESHAIAIVAWEAKVPFLVIRAIADTANSSVPTAAQGCIGPDGKPRTALVLSRLCLRPWELTDLKRLQSDAKAAHKALWSLKPLAEVLFGGP